MQIFRPHPNLKSCAKVLDDKRVIKMPVEAAQIASTALWVVNCGVAEVMYSKNLIYLPTHEFHPLCKWVAEHWLNYAETIIAGFKLCDEYKYRFGKEHNTIYKLRNLWNILPDKYRTDLYETQQPNSTTHHKHISNVYEAYKQELIYKWSTTDKRPPKWTKRGIPVFYRDYLIDKHYEED